MAHTQKSQLKETKKHLTVLAHDKNSQQARNKRAFNHPTKGN